MRRTQALQGNQAVRCSHLLLDRTRRAGQIAVSEGRIFYTTLEFPPASAPGSSSGGASAFGLDTAVSGTAGAGGAGPPTLPAVTSVTLETLQLSAGQLVRLPSIELRMNTTMAGNPGSCMHAASGPSRFATTHSQRWTHRTRRRRLD